MLRLLASLSLLLPIAVGFNFFQERIPNGDRIPHPCWPNYLWHGVGHLNALGGGPRNPFGLDFHEAGKKFTKELCMADSDQDGMTNGEELGDPDCTWSVGGTPDRTSGLSHPGVCQPLNSEKCKKLNDWDFCTRPEYKCNDTETEDVRNITIRFPETAVPAKETNYYCMLFNLPNDRDYHIVGDKPFIDNLEVMHHILVYGCDLINEELVTKYSEPAKCGMLTQSSCGTQIAGWTVGSIGNCLNGLDAGMRIGKTKYSTVLMEFHWNNPRMQEGMTDSSGMTLYYTPNLRTYDMGILSTGNMGLLLPPGKKEYHQDSTCKSKCTEQRLTEPIKIVSIGLHMHYLGYAGHVHQYRNGTLLRELATDNVYRYDSPVEHEVNPPAELLPGDELVTRCTFKTTSRNDIVYYGDSTQQEMCFAFISYYPEIGFRDCIQFGEIDTCKPPGEEFQPEVLNGCLLSDEELSKELFTKLSENCDLTGQVCHPECRKMLVEEVHPCFKGDVKLYYEFILTFISDELTFLVTAMRSCDMERIMPTRTTDDPSKNNNTSHGETAMPRTTDDPSKNNNPSHGERAMPGQVIVLLAAMVMAPLLRNMM